MNVKIKIIFIALISFLMLSCEGILWDGSTRSIENEETIIIITIKDPMWNAYLEWLELQ